MNAWGFQTMMSSVWAKGCNALLHLNPTDKISIYVLLNWGEVERIFNTNLVRKNLPTPELK
jgi:hypothetical protein